MLRLRRHASLLALGLLILFPSVTRAQASIAGIVKDTSGAVLPGVTIEASSPVLIEKTRSVVSDSTSQFKIIDLRPGVYSVTFALPGFNTIKRDGVLLEGSFTAAVNAEMKIGAVEETITVTSEAPTVDVQSTTKERVLSHDIIDNVPGGAKTYATLGVLVPSVALGGGSVNQDVGGSFGGAQVNLIVHGSKVNDLRVMQNGVSTMTLVTAGGGIAGSTPNAAAAQEVTIDTGSVSAELATGGPRINYIPRDGGNTFSGFVIGSYTGSSLEGNNFTQALKDRGLLSADSIKKIWDFNPGLGGPISKDKIWFFAAARHFGSNLYAGGMYYNLNALNPNAWTYAPDLSHQASNDQTWKDAQMRVTVQATPKNKLAFTADWQTRCSCPSSIGISTGGTPGYRTPEAANDGRYPQQRLLHAEWSSPVTSRLLLEAVGLHRLERFGGYPTALEGFPYPGIVSVNEQSSNLTYRANQSYGDNLGANYAFRAAASYVTGAHAFKVGFNDVIGYYNPHTYTSAPVSYRFNNGVPNQVTIWDTPYVVNNNEDGDFGVFVQDRWTVRRWTLSYGARYDNFRTSFPEQFLGPTALLPNQNLTLPAQSSIDWKDFTPRFGAVWNVFASGKTAVKVSANKYLQGQALGGLGSQPNPVNTLVLSTSRAWTDRNGNFTPDCNLTAPAANGECGALANAAFGQQGTTTFDPDLLTGWNHRTYNWEFSAGVQQQLAPRVSVDVSYFRRIYGNFQVTDNLLVSASDYTPYSITAPVDSRLPGGGGYAVTGLFDLNSNKVGQVKNLNTLSDKYGSQYEHWNGVDINMNARLANGVLIQGGIGTGRTVTDDCSVESQLPEMLVAHPVTSNTSTVTTTGVLQSQTYCHMQEPWITQFKVLGSYTFRKADVQISGTYQSIPGPVVQANFVATNAAVSPSLGRNLSSGSNVTVNLVAPGAMYGDRLNQLDLRVGKIVKIGTSKLNLNVDLYNALNANAVTAQNDAYGVWQTPLRIMLARFVKFSAQFNF